jgi:hypothetical protein
VKFPTVSPIEGWDTAEVRRVEESASSMRSPRSSYFGWVDRGLSRRARHHRHPGGSGPQPGDLILRESSAGGFEIVDAITDEHIAGPMQLSRAIQAAKAYGAITLWQQNVDHRGRALGRPQRIELT